jgi:hypothetical protein
VAALFEERYPNIAAWVQDGWIEIGHDSNSGSFIRVLDEGGLYLKRSQFEILKKPRVS